MAIMAIALIGGMIKLLNYRGEQQLHEQFVEKAKQAVTQSALESGLPKPSVFDSEYAGTQIIKMQKIDDMTLKHTLQLDKGYDNLSKDITPKMQTYFKDFTTSKLCVKPDLKDLIKAGMNNQFEYQFGNGQKITEFTVTAKECEPYWKAE